MFVPLAHPPGHAQADFGEADVIIAGVKRRAHFFAMDLPHSDAYLIVAYPAAATEAWLDGHTRAFAFFGGVPQSILYDNDKCLVSRILSDGTRQRTRAFSGLQSHYLFEDRYGRPGKGNDKGPFDKLRMRGGGVGWLRPNHTGKNAWHGMTGQFRRSLFGRLGGNDDVNDADRLGRDPAMHWIVGGKAIERHAASTSQMGRFETELLASDENLEAMTATHPAGRMATIKGVNINEGWYK